MDDKSYDPLWQMKWFCPGLQALRAASPSCQGVSPILIRASSKDSNQEDDDHAGGSSSNNSSRSSSKNSSSRRSSKRTSSKRSNMHTASSSVRNETPSDGTSGLDTEGTPLYSMHLAISSLTRASTANTYDWTLDPNCFHGDSMVCIPESAEAQSEARLHVLNMVSLEWLRHPAVLSFWAWTWACRFLETRPEAVGRDFGGLQHIGYCLADSLGTCPSWLVAIWLVSAIGDLPMWPGPIITILITTMRTADCVYFDGASGVVVPMIVMLLVLALSFTAKPDRRPFLRAATVIGIVSASFVFIWARWQGCLMHFMPNRLCFLALRSMLPSLYEFASRKSLGWCWQRWSGTTPPATFMTLICAHAMNANMLQLANFLHCLEYPNPILAALRLSATVTFCDIMARTKTLAILSKACLGWPFVLDDAADLALRSRWLYVYALFPFILSFALLTMNYLTAMILLIHLCTEVVSDLILLTFQCLEHRRQGRAMTFMETWRRVRGPFGHVFPLGLYSRHCNPGFEKSTQFRPQEPLPHWFCIDAKAMVGLLLVILPSNVIYRCLEGAFIKRSCY